MARLKTGADSAASIPNITPGINQRQEATAMADAMKFQGQKTKEFGETIRQEGVVLEKRVGVFETAVAESEYNEQILKIGAEVEQMPDHTKWQEEYDRRVKQASEAASQKIGSSDLKARFSANATQQRARGGEAMRRLAKAKNNKVQQAVLLNKFDANLKIAINTQDEKLRMDTINSMHSMIDAAVKEHGLSPLVAFNMKQKFVADFATGMALTRSKGQLIEDIDKIRKEVDGKIVWSEKLSGTYLDLIPKDQLELMYRKAVAGSAGDRELGTAQSIVDLQFENKKGTLAGRRAQLRTTKFYTDQGIKPRDIAGVRKQAMALLEARSSQEATDRGAVAATTIANGTNANGTPYTRADAQKDVLKLPVNEQVAASKRVDIIYNERDEAEIQNRTKAIATAIDAGKYINEAHAMAQTEGLREDIKKQVKANIKSIFDDARAIKKNELLAHKQKQVDTFDEVEDLMAKGMSIFKIWKSYPELHAILTPQQRTSLENGVDTDYGRFDAITEMNARELRDLDLSVERNNLAPAEFAIARHLKTQAGQGKKDFDEKGSPSQVISAVISSHGLGGTKKQKARGRLKAMFLADVARQEAEKKRKLTNKELVEIASQMTSDVMVPGGFWDAWMVQKIPAYKITMSNQQRQQIIEAYKAKGNNNPTQQQITDSFLKWQEDQ